MASYKRGREARMSEAEQIQYRIGFEDGRKAGMEEAAKAAEEWFLDHGGKTHEPIAVALAIRAAAERLP